MTTAYLWLKAFHIFGVVCWFAGLFYLPRLFVYHTMAHDKTSSERFTMMEEKLYRIIMRPAMIIAIVFGLWIMVLAWDAFANSLWLWLKILGVVILLGYHHYCGRLIKAFALAVVLAAFSWCVAIAAIVVGGNRANLGRARRALLLAGTPWYCLAVYLSTFL